MCNIEYKTEHSVPLSIFYGFLLRVVFIMIIIALGLVVHQAANAEEVFLSSSSGENIVTIYTYPDGVVLGYHYNGTPALTINGDGEWMQVAVGGDNGQVGYVATSSLSHNSAYEITTSICVGVINGHEQVALRADPISNGKIDGIVLGGTRLKVIGKINDYYHVWFGSISGYIDQNELTLTKELVYPDSFANIEEIGYAILQDIDDMDDLKLMTFPDPFSKAIDNPWFRSQDSIHSMEGTAFDMLADLGDWLQIRILSSNYEGFVLSRYFKKAFLNCIIFNPSTLTLKEGKFVIGEDIPSGLYTYEISDFESGKMEIIAADGKIEKIINKKGAYTFLAQDQAYITLEGQGRLLPMENKVIISKDTPFTNASNGMFFIPIQFERYSYSTTGMEYEISALNDGSGYCKFYNLLGKEVGCVNLSSDETVYYSTDSYIDIRFIEIYNCTLKIIYTHNG